MTVVNIDRKVSSSVLETALVNAAKEFKWRVDVRDNFRKEYQLGSVHEISVYDGKDVILMGRLRLRALDVTIPPSDPTDYFYVYKGGFASEKKVKKYLSAVSRNLSNS